MAASKIEWTDRSDWNPLRGCTRLSQGCVHCYAETLAARFSDPGQAFHGFAERTSAGGRWTGRVEVMWDRLHLPLRWRKPAMIFGNSTSDLFHESLAGHDIAMIFAVAVAAHHLRGHTTQFLTKRADRMRELLASEEFWDVVNAQAGALVMELVDPLDRRSDDARAMLEDYGPKKPAPGVWLGISVEDRLTMIDRALQLRDVPAAVSFWSVEPLLGPLGSIPAAIMPDWVICGGESGRGARPMHPDWVRSLRDQCATLDVPFFFKQWGEWAPVLVADDDEALSPAFRAARGKRSFLLDGVRMGWVGKNAAGRMLDGVTHDGVPA